MFLPFVRLNLALDEPPLPFERPFAADAGLQCQSKTSRNSSAHIIFFMTKTSRFSHLTAQSIGISKVPINAFRKHIFITARIHAVNPEKSFLWSDILHFGQL